MPIPKHLKAALESWKEGKGEFPDGLDSGVFFENEGQFLSEAERKAKPKLSEAERKAATAAKEARETVLAEIVEQLGVKDPEQISEIKARLAAADGTATEFDKFKATATKTEKELRKEVDKLTKEHAELSGFKVKVVKDNALAPHLAKIHPDLRDVMAENWAGKLVIGEDGKVTAPEGKDIAAFVDDAIKNKPSLKAPDYKPGAGSKPGEKTTAKPDAGSNGTSNGTNGESKKYDGSATGIHQAFVEAFTAQAAKGDGTAQ